MFPFHALLRQILWCSCLRVLSLLVSFRGHMLVKLHGRVLWSMSRSAMGPMSLVLANRQGLLSVSPPRCQLRQSLHRQLQHPSLHQSHHRWRPKDSLLYRLGGHLWSRFLLFRRSKAGGALRARTNRLLFQDAGTVLCAIRRVGDHAVLPRVLGRGLLGGGVIGLRCLFILRTIVGTVALLRGAPPAYLLAARESLMKY